MNETEKEISKNGMNTQNKISEELKTLKDLENGFKVVGIRELRAEAIKKIKLFQNPFEKAGNFKDIIFRDKKLYELLINCDSFERGKIIEFIKWDNDLSKEDLEDEN